MFYTECVGHRWARQAVSYKTLDEARREAARSSHDCSHVNVWDCAGSPVGTLVAVYVDGKERTP